MTSKELPLNEQPEVFRMTACKTYNELCGVYSEIIYGKSYRHYSKEYKEIIKDIYLQTSIILNEKSYQI